MDVQSTIASLNDPGHDSLVVDQRRPREQGEQVVDRWGVLNTLV